MGGANNICSDKTGTLTMNKMTITDVWAGKEYKVKVNDEKYQLNEFFKQEKHGQLFCQALTCNTLGTLEAASATELAMLQMMNKFGIPIE